MRNLPGLWIQHPDRDFAFVVQMVLSATYDQLDEAELLLRLFNALQEDHRLITARPPDDSWEVNKLRSLYARSFAYAVDTLSQLLLALPKIGALPSGVQAHIEQFQQSFGSIRELRNSLHHIEDRLRTKGRMGKGGQERALPPGLVIMGHLVGNKFGCTAANGLYAEIELSAATLATASQIVDDIVWCFDWLGPADQPVRRSCR